MATVNGPGKFDDLNNPPQTLIYTGALADEKYRNALLAGVIDAIKRYDFDGAYFDGNIRLTGSTNARSGLGYQGLDGRPHPTYPIFANREFFRQLYEVLHPMGKRIDVHNSAYVGTAGHGLCR